MSPRRLLVSAVALLCLLQAVVGAGTVAATTTNGSEPVDELAQTTATPTNNTTIQQEDPDDVDEAGNTDALRSYLARSLAERLNESAVRISQQEYEQGQSVLGDEYDSLLEKYVDVAGGTDSDAEEFEEVAETQRELGSTAQAYNETYQEYLEAKDAGNTTRARELARELDRLASEVNESAQQLSGSYTEIESETGANLSGAQTQVTNTSQEISEQQQEIVSETFVRTNLSVRTNSTTISFTEPAQIRGQLTLENGSSLANSSIEVQVGNRTQAVRTDDEGVFTLEYRPVTIPHDAANITVAYLPASESVYLGDNASLNVTVTQTNATLTVTTESSTTQFGENLTVTGEARVDGVPVAGACVRLIVGGTTFATVRTAANGTYAVTSEVPASIASGDQSVTAVIVPGNRAVRSEPVTAPLRVEPTETTLRVNATRVGEDIRLTGTLETADGRPVGNQTVELRLNGTTVATVDTEANGTFSRVVTPQAGLSGEVTVQAVYDEPGTNLASASARTSLDLAVTPAGDVGPISLDLLAGGGAIVLSVLAIGWLVRRDETSTGTGSAPTASPSSTVDASTGSDTGTGLLEDATSLFNDGNADAAIRTLYAAVRHSLNVGEASQTHWEFYTTASEQLSSDAAGTLERLTEAYERVVYSPDGVETEQADDLLEDADALLGGSDDESVS